MEAEVVAVAEVEEEEVVVQAALVLTDAAGVEVGDATLERHTEEPADDGALRGDLALDAGVHLVEDGGANTMIVGLSAAPSPSCGRRRRSAVKIARCAPR